MKDCSNCGYCPNGMELDMHGSVYWCDLNGYNLHPHILLEESFMKNCKSWISKGQQTLFEVVK